MTLEQIEYEMKKTGDKEKRRLNREQWDMWEQEVNGQVKGIL